MPQVAAAVAALDASPAATLRDGGAVGITIDGKDHPLGADDVQMVLQPLEGYQLERAGTHAVALNLELDDELRREGLAREVVHAVQERAQERGPERRGPDRADARRRRRAARRRARARGVRGGRDARDLARVRRRRRRRAATIEGRELRIAVERQ